MPGLQAKLPEERRGHMDLRAYYKKMREIEDLIEHPFAVIVSRETPDGGRKGVVADVARSVAARMIADGKADLAGADETAKFRAEVEANWKAAQESAACVDADLRALRNALKPSKKG